MEVSAVAAASAEAVVEAAEAVELPAVGKRWFQMFRDLPLPAGERK
jgi:hypothetical protein